MCCPAPKYSTTRNQPYNLNKGDYAKLRNLLDMVDWSAEIEHLNTNESWDFLLAHLHKAISCSILKKFIHIRKKHFYINCEAMKLKHQKESMWKNTVPLVTILITVGMPVKRICLEILLVN